MEMINALALYVRSISHPELPTSQTESNPPAKVKDDEIYLIGGKMVVKNDPFFMKHIGWSSLRNFAKEGSSYVLFFDGERIVVENKEKRTFMGDDFISFLEEILKLEKSKLADVETTEDETLSIPDWKTPLGGLVSKTLMPNTILTYEQMLRDYAFSISVGKPQIKLTPDKKIYVQDDTGFKALFTAISTKSYSALATIEGNQSALEKLASKEIPVSE